MLKTHIAILVFFTLYDVGSTYSAYNDALIIRDFLKTKSDPPKDHAKVARNLVHKSKWASSGTISTIESIKGFPMVNIISISDSAKGAPSTGNIYFLLTMLDFTGQDIKKDNKMTFMISNDEDLSCSNKNGTDPMEPTCARVIISGKVIEIDQISQEYEFGLNAFVSRHPAAKTWLKAHEFFLCKLNISNIFVLDWYGGPHTVTIEEYYKAQPDVSYEIYDAIENEINAPQQELHIKINKNKYKTIKIEV